MIASLKLTGRIGIAITAFIGAVAMASNAALIHRTALLEDRQGNLWEGTRGGGLSLLDRETGTVRHYPHDPNRDDSLSDNRVRCIFQDRNGYFWSDGYFWGDSNAAGSSNAAVGVNTWVEQD